MDTIELRLPRAAAETLATLLHHLRVQANARAEQRGLLPLQRRDARARAEWLAQVALPLARALHPADGVRRAVDVMPLADDAGTRPRGPYERRGAA